MTRAEGTKGFPAILRELIWRANFSYAPEYTIYSTQIGPGLVEYSASVFLHRRLMELWKAEPKGPIPLLV